MPVEVLAADWSAELALDAALDRLLALAAGTNEDADGLNLNSFAFGFSFVGAAVAGREGAGVLTAELAPCRSKTRVEVNNKGQVNNKGRVKNEGRVKSKGQAARKRTGHEVVS